MSDWTLRGFMDALVAVLETADSGNLRVYRWRPLAALPELPAVWNWLEPSRAEWADSAYRKDTLRIEVTVAVTPGDEQLGALEDLADRMRVVLDDECGKTDPFGVPQVRRLGMSTGAEDFNGVPLLVVRFPLEAELERLVA